MCTGSQREWHISHNHLTIILTVIFRLQDIVPVAWVNMCLFDYKGRLEVGDKDLYMWSYDDDEVYDKSFIVHHLGKSVSLGKCQ